MIKANNNSIFECLFFPCEFLSALQILTHLNQNGTIKWYEEESKE